MATETKKAKKEHSHDGHRERLKNRYLKEGLSNFEPHQILEMLLFYACPRRDTNQMAHNMIDDFGSLNNLLEANPIDIADKCNVSLHVAILTSLILPISKVYFETSNKKGEVIDSVRKASEVAKSLFVGIKEEYFYMICLDIHQRLLTTVLLKKGDLDEVQLYPRQLLKEVLRTKAHSVILTHNHPSGIVRPSSEDLSSTENIKNALYAIDVELLDHIIIGIDKYYSFSEKGKLDTVY